MRSVATRLLELLCYAILMSRAGRPIPYRLWLWMCARASAEAARRGEW